jgi:hypothetical protein
MACVGAMFDVIGRSTVGTADADAPPTIDRVNPAAPRTGAAFVTCFFFEACFTRGIVASSIPCGKMFRVQRTDSTLCKYTMQGWLRIAVHQQDHDRAHHMPRVHRVPAIHLHEQTSTQFIPPKYS